MIKCKKILSIAVAAVFAGSILFGCTNEAVNKDIPSMSNNSPNKVTDTPLELTIFMHYWNTYVFDDEWPVYKKAAEMTNIQLKGIAPSSQSDSQQAYNIVMASGDLPDIIHNTKDNINKYMSDGAFQPLDDLIDKYAPNFKKYLMEHPNIKKNVMAGDGKMYFIPTLFEGKASEGYFVRKDWLDKLNLSEPKTVDDFYNMLKAFKTQDANGNGKNDEIPYFSRAQNINSLFQLFGLNGTFQIADGKVYYSPYVPEFKIAMVNLAKWYKEGLIDNEIFTRGPNSRDVLLGDNVGGVTHDWFTSTSQYNDKLKDKIPGFEFIPVKPPEDINGKVWEGAARREVAETGWGISCNNKHAAETIKYFDFWFSEEGLRLNNYGIEGVHYTMVDGKPKYKAELINGKEPLTKLLWNDGALLNIGTHMLYEAEQQYMNPIARQGVDMYNDNITIDAFPLLPFSAEEQKLVTTKLPAINTYTFEIVQKWLMGAEPVEANFDKHIATLKSLGMDEVLKVYNDAYQRYIQ